MNREAVFHQSDSHYCFALDEHSLVIRLRMAKADKKSQVTLVYGNKYQFAKKHKEAPLTYLGSDRRYAYFQVTLTLSDTRLAYVFHIHHEGESFYYSETGLTSGYDFDGAYQSYFQMPYINAIDVHKEVTWSSQGSFYQIFVDRFAIGDDRTKPHVTMAWSEKPKPRSFAGGDLRGITRKLDYLEDLGIGAIYLTPIFKSLSNHKYDISDYYLVDPHFGDKADLKELVTEAHKRGIRIVLDAVFNHSSDLLPEFQDVMAHGRASRYYDWFMIDGDFPQAKPLNYQTFASVSNMPKWNTSNPEVQQYLLDITRFWMTEVDIDGWRLDVSDEVSHDFWRRFRAEVKRIKPDAIIIGENWHQASSYLQGDQFDSVMNYAFSRSVISFLMDEAFTKEDFASDLTGILMQYTRQVNRMNLNLLDSHDTHRLITQLKGDHNKFLAALALLMVFEGSPCIYYGTEVALEGGYDPDCRRGMPWEKADANNPLWQQVRCLLQLRQNELALQKGETRLITSRDFLQLERAYLGDNIMLYLNDENVLKDLPEGHVLFSHGLKDGKLGTYGVAIIKHSASPL